SLAVVQPMKSVPEFIPPETISLAEIKKKQDIRINHLPVDVRQSFQEDLTLRLIEMYGIERPWSVNLPDSRIIDLFKQVFPQHGAFSDSTQGKKIILKKADDALTTWHNKISQTTITYMENNLIWELPDTLLEYISAWCHWALDGDFKSRPFYYKEYLDPGAEGNEGNEKPLKLNIFCHSIIACTLGYHLGHLLPIPAHLKSAQLPSGALITAIQSVSVVAKLLARVDTDDMFF
ncbi:hypothetical protein CPB84DRAFT_1687286, partial [Gymnopilus junonius]